MTNKRFVAIFIIFLLLALPINASVSNRVYPLGDNVVPLRINKISNNNLNIDTSVKINASDITIDSISIEHIALSVNLDLNINRENNMPDQLDVLINDTGIRIIENLSGSIGISSVQYDTLYVSTDKSLYYEYEQIDIMRGMEHSGPAEIVIEYLTLIKSDNSQGSLGSYNWDIPGYSSLYLPTLNLAASLALNAMGEGDFFIRSVIYSSDGKSVAENSDWFNMQYSSNELVLEGYVKDENGAKVSGADVMFTDCSNNLVVGDVTDSNGYFKLETIAGSYKLKVTYNSITYLFTINSQECYSWSSGSYDIGALQISAYAALNGRVEDEFGNPLGVEVSWTDCSDNFVTGMSAVGDFTLSALAGSYKLKIVYNGITYIISIANEECHYYSPGTHNLNTPLVIPVKIHISGIVLDESGNPVQDAVVKFTDCNDNPGVEDVTDANGEFNLVADPGNYKFKIIVDYDGRLVTLSYTFNGDECPYWQNGYLQFNNPFVISSTFILYGYLKDPDDNPLENYDIELYDCSEIFVDSAPTDLNGYFSITKDVGEYKIMINLGGGWKMKLVDQDDNDCFFLLGDINLRTLNINPTADCSIFDYACYQGDIKLFDCYWNEEERGCFCYGTECSYGCTDGLEGCDPGSYGMIVVDVDNINDNYNPQSGAHVYLDGLYQGAADGLGKKYLNALYGYRNVVINCPDATYCDAESVYVDSSYEYVYFDCGCGIETHDTKLKFITEYGTIGSENIIQVDNFALSNIDIFLDGEYIGITNPQGYRVLDDIPEGVHNLRIELKVYTGYESGEYEIWAGETAINVNTDGEFLFSVEADQGAFSLSSILINKTGSHSLKIYNRDYQGNFFCVGLCLGAVAVGAVILEYGMMAWDTYDVDVCAEENPGNIAGECWDEGAWLVINFIPDGGIIPIIGRIGRVVNHYLDEIKVIGKIKSSRKIGQITKIVTEIKGNIIEGYIRHADDGSKVMRITKGAIKSLKAFRAGVKNLIKPVKIYDGSGRLVAVSIGQKSISKGAFGKEFGSYLGRMGEDSLEQYFHLIKRNVDDSVEVVIMKGNVGKQIKTTNYIFEYAGDSGKQIVIFENIGGSRGKSIGELDSLVIVNGKPVIGEAKIQSYEGIEKSFLKKDADGQLSIIRTKINPVKELAEKNGWEAVDPEILLMGPKDAIEEGLKPGKKLKDYYDRYDWLDVDSLSNTKAEFDELARLLGG